ncbi:unnamed protein product [Arctogadus glacialis]
MHVQVSTTDSGVQTHCLVQNLFIWAVTADTAVKSKAVPRPGSQRHLIKHAHGRSYLQRELRYEAIYNGSYATKLSTTGATLRSYLQRELRYEAIYNGSYATKLQLGVTYSQSAKDDNIHLAHLATAVCCRSDLKVLLPRTPRDTCPVVDPTGHLPGRGPHGTPARSWTPRDTCPVVDPTGHLPGRGPHGTPARSWTRRDTCPAVDQTGHLPGRGPDGTPARPWTRRDTCPAVDQTGHLPGRGPDGTPARPWTRRAALSLTAPLRWGGAARPDDGLTTA